MARKPETHYAKGPGGDIAYQVVGDGPIDLVVVPGWTSHVDLMWAAPGWTCFNEELASFARVAALAGPGEVLVSNTVKDLVNGSGITFRDRGTHALKGLPGEWQLFSPSGQQDDPVESLLAASQEV